MKVFGELVVDLGDPCRCLGRVDVPLSTGVPSRGLLDKFVRCGYAAAQSSSCRINLHASSLQGRTSTCEGIGVEKRTRIEPGISSMAKQWGTMSSMSARVWCASRGLPMKGRVIQSGEA